MKRTVLPVAVYLLCFITLIGCSNNGNPDPLNPALTANNTVKISGQSAPTHLWGWYEVSINPEEMTAEVVVNRQAMFTANVVNFINSNPANLGFLINGITPGTGYMDIDIDVTINHPFPGLPQYNGYDVRGVFIGNGSEYLDYNGSLCHAEIETDQFMMNDPVDGVGGPDGYTRWYNQPEFSGGGMPLFQYTDGKYATPGFEGSAILNPYKYFADGLEAEEDLWEWIINHTNQNGQFSSGATNTRNYFLRFPDSTGVTFGYAIIASWIDDDTHPANAPEASACMVADNSDVWFDSPTSFGGNIDLDISLFNWDMQPSTIFIESTVLSAPHELTGSEMNPISGTDQYSTYHVEIAADDVDSVAGNEYWVIAQYDSHDYKNIYGIVNDAGDDPLAAFFRYDLNVSGDVPAWIEVIDPNGGEMWQVGADEDINWSSENVTGTVFIEYSKDNFVSDINTIATDEPNDGSYTWTSIPNDPSDTVRVRVSSTSAPSVFDISDEDFSIILPQEGWGVNFGPSAMTGGKGLAVDSDGNVFVSGKFMGTIDFDPGPGIESKTSNGGYDVYVSKFDTLGNFQWVKTFGGSAWEYNRGLAVDGSGNVYLPGYFAGTVDFDPGTGVDNHTSNGNNDCFLVKLDGTGAFQWARTWGGTMNEDAYGAECDSSGNVYITGQFWGYVDFDPGSGTDTRSSAGAFDVFLLKLDSSGNYLWAKTWGGTGFWDYGHDIAVDDSDNVYTTGWFDDTVDFDPGSGSDWHTADSNQGIFLSKLDSSGNFQWAQTWGGSWSQNYDFGIGIECDGSSTIAVAGRYRDTVDFDPGSGVDSHSALGEVDAFVSTFDLDGNFQWVRTWGSTGWDSARGIGFDSNGNVIVGGHFGGMVDFDPDPVDTETHTSSYLGCFVSKFDSTGDFIWVRIVDAIFNDRSGMLAVDGYDSIYHTGILQGTAEMAPVDPPCNEPSDPHSSSGECDSFIVKYLSDGCW